MVLSTQEGFPTAATSRLCALPGRMLMHAGVVQLWRGLVDERAETLRKRKEESTFPRKEAREQWLFLSFLFSLSIGTFFISPPFWCQWRKLHSKTISHDVTCHFASHTKRPVRTSNFALSYLCLLLFVSAFQANRPCRRIGYPRIESSNLIAEDIESYPIMDGGYNIRH
jgi:hypothetical protein